MTHYPSFDTYPVRLGGKGYVFRSRLSYMRIQVRAWFARLTVQDYLAAVSGPYPRGLHREV